MNIYQNHLQFAIVQSQVTDSELKSYEEFKFTIFFTTVIIRCNGILTVVPTVVSLSFKNQKFKTGIQSDNELYCTLLCSVKWQIETDKHADRLKYTRKEIQSEF